MDNGLLQALAGMFFPQAAQQQGDNYQPAPLENYPSIYDGINALSGKAGALRSRDLINRLSDGAAQTNDMRAAEKIGDAVPRGPVPPLPPPPAQPMPLGGSPIDRINGGFEDAGAGAAIPPNASPTVGDIPPGIPRPSMPLPPPNQPPPPSGVPEGGPYNTGPGDPYKVAPPMWGPGAPTMPPQSGGQGGFLAEALGLPQDRLSAGARALAAGLSKVAGGKGGAFSQGMGGALTGGNGYEDAQDKRKVDLLDRAIRLRGQDTDADYKNRALDSLDNYRNASLDTKTAKGPNGTVPGKLEILADRLVKESGGTLAFQDALNMARRSPNGSAEDLKRERMALDAARQDPKFGTKPDEVLEKWRNKYGLKPAAAPASEPVPTTIGTPAPAPAAQPQRQGKPGVANPSEYPTLSMDGNGSQQSPYKPTTAADYDDIEPGTYYIHPSDGRLRLKK